ncbi:hypothetical protein BV22DRAFT_993914, partial [Leucogyrophana mollusca]
MIGCNFLVQISEALATAKGNGLAFGNMNIIFAGDLAQLPAVGQTRLYARVKTRKVSTTYGQNTIFGKLLWLSVKTVVLLTEVMRQSGNENERFVTLLGRLRHGKCTEEDYQLLNTRLVSNVKPDWEPSGWSNAPIIVSSNDVKDKLNARATAEFAYRTGRKLHWYYCCD